MPWSDNHENANSNTNLTDVQKRYNEIFVLVNESSGQMKESKRILRINKIYQLSDRLLKSDQFTELKQEEKYNIAKTHRQAVIYLLVMLNLKDPTKIQERINKLIIKMQMNKSMRKYVGEDASPLTQEEKRIRKEVHSDNILDKEIDPTKIPKAELLVGNLVDENVAALRAKKNWIRIAKLVLAKQRKKIVTVNMGSRVIDEIEKTRMFTPNEREGLNLQLSFDGKLIRREPDNKFYLYDSSDSQAHSKPGFVAFVMNMSGELSVFQHFFMMDQVAHSSINRQRPVLCAGEMQVVNGEINVITAHSGHYKPTFDNIYEMLKVLKERGVNFDNTLIVFATHHQSIGLPKTLNRSTKTSMVCNIAYQKAGVNPPTYNAKEFFEEMQKLEQLKKQFQSAKRLLVIASEVRPEKVEEYRSRIINFANADLLEAKVFLVMMDAVTSPKKVAKYFSDLLILYDNKLPDIATYVMEDFFKYPALLPVKSRDLFIDYLYDKMKQRYSDLSEWSELASSNSSLDVRYHFYEEMSDLRSNMYKLLALQVDAKLEPIFQLADKDGKNIKLIEEKLKKVVKRIDPDQMDGLITRVQENFRIPERLADNKLLVYNTFIAILESKKPKVSKEEKISGISSPTNLSPRKR